MKDFYLLEPQLPFSESFFFFLTTTFTKSQHFWRENKKRVNFNERPFFPHRGALMEADQNSGGNAGRDGDPLKSDSTARQAAAGRRKPTPPASGY